MKYIPPPSISNPTHYSNSITLLLMLIFILVLTACGGGDSTEAGNKVEVSGHISRNFTPANPEAGVGDVNGGQPLRMFVSLRDGEQRAAILSFFVDTAPGTYPIDGQGAIATYTDEGVIYIGVSGSLVLTSVTEQLSGTFEFSGKRLDSEDSITVKGSFADIPLSG